MEASPKGTGMRQEKAPPHVTNAMFDIVENQIRDNDPKETKATLMRLMDSGIERHEAIRLIASVVGNEIFHVLKFKEEFNEPRFVANLQKLPTMPWE
jgi:hypothetical protein